MRQQNFCPHRVGFFMAPNGRPNTAELLATIRAKLGDSHSGQLDALLRVLGTLDLPNLNIILNHFVEAVKVLKVRQDISSKPQLKPKGVRAALQLIAFHYEKTRDVDVRNDGLNQLLVGRDIGEAEALDFYENKVMGKVLDKGNREIIIDDDGMQYLYKDSQSGKHVVDAANFQSIRAKRMPWIRWAIQNSVEVYFQEVERKDGDQSWHTFGYLQSFMVPYRNRETGAESFSRNYFFVIVRRKKKNAPLEFVTAYHFDDHESLLKRVAGFEPFYLDPK
ncbi:MAG: hypothetical protein WCU88_01740 [Elusimicrobiota bacterium]